MITSWKSFFAAVEQMRECQKAFLRDRSYTALMTARRCEAEVDNFIKIKRSEWAQEKQLERIGEET